MRKSTRVIAVCLVGGQRSQRLVGLPALDAGHWQAKCRQAMKERRGHSARLEQNALNGRTFRQGGGDCFRHGWRPDLKNDLPVSIDDADMRLFHRDVQSGKILHGALLFTSESRYYRLSGSSRPLPDVEKCGCIGALGSKQTHF